MTGKALPIDASGGSPSYAATDWRRSMSAAMGFATSARPLGGWSGVRPGTPTTTVSCASGSWSCAAFASYMDKETPSANAGYFCYADGTDTGAITAADATNPRIDIIYMVVNDTAVDSSGSRNFAIVYQAGTAAPSPVAPSPTDTSGVTIAQINVPAGAGGENSATVTWVAPYCAAAGGVVLAKSSTYYPSSPYAGLEVYDINLGYKLRYNGSAWVGDGVWTAYTPSVSAGSGSFTSVSASAQYAIVGKTMYWHADVTITTNGTAAGGIGITLPSGYTTAAQHSVLGREDAISGKTLGGHVTTNTVTVFNYDGTYAGASGALLRVDAVIRVN